MRLGALFVVLVGINVYVFFFRGGTSIQDVLKSSSINKQSRLVGAASAGKGRKKGKSQADPSDDSIVIRGNMKGHLGLSSALQDRNIAVAQINELIAVLKPNLNMRSLRPRHTFEARLDPATKKIRKFVFRLSPISAVVVTRTAGGGLKAMKDEVQLVTKEHRVGGRIHSSLTKAMTDAGEGSALASRFINLFSWDVNWYADPRNGDEFRIVVEKKYMDGKFFRYGKILAAEYKGNVGRYQAFYHKPRGKKGNYYTPEGRCIRRDFLKTPLNFKRISSGFNKRRFHPVLHRTKGHFGVDYSAAPGTPIWAVADAVVVRAGRYGGAGNKIVLKHKDKVVTEYMHMSRFARGMKRGVKVRQRQVIGYVGSTGLATGPHLHYGVYVKGKYVDPMRFSVGRGELLPRQLRHRFLDDLPTQMAILEGIKVTPSED